MTQKSPFIVSSYVVNPCGRLAPLLPKACLHGVVEDDCKIYIHSWRERKTGPAHPLAVICCSTHGVFLTIYPPGFAPYLRQPLVDVSPSGRDFSFDVAEKDAPELPPLRFRGTRFEAAYDASAGIAWDREPYSPYGRWWQTQRRRVDECCRLLGLHPEPDDVKVREVVSRILEVPQMVLELERGKVADTPGYRIRGAAVVTILDKLSGVCDVERLTLAGHVNGLWGCPFWWDGETGRLSPAPFQQPETKYGDLLRDYEATQ